MGDCRIFKIIQISLVLIALASNSFAATRSNSGYPCNDRCEAGRAKIALLVKQFELKKEYYSSKAYSEAAVRKDFIDPFFKALGWDVTNQLRRYLFQQDSIPETRLKIGRHMNYADYGFRIDGRVVIYVEAEAVKRDVDNAPHVLQAKRYAWYFRPDDWKSRSRGNSTMDEIREKFGSSRPYSGGYNLIGQGS